jgi:hypothetical protein
MNRGAGSEGDNLVRGLGPPHRPRRGWYCQSCSHSGLNSVSKPQGKPPVATPTTLRGAPTTVSPVTLAAINGREDFAIYKDQIGDPGTHLLRRAAGHPRRPGRRSQLQSALHLRQRDRLQRRADRKRLGDAPEAPLSRQGAAGGDSPPDRGSVPGSAGPVPVDGVVRHVVAALENATFAPNLATAPRRGSDFCSNSASEAIIPIVNGPFGANNPQRQGLQSAVAGPGDPLDIIREELECSDRSDPAACSALQYSPLWDVTPVAWKRRSRAPRWLGRRWRSTQLRSP